MQPTLFGTTWKPEVADCSTQPPFNTQTDRFDWAGSDVPSRAQGNLLSAVLFPNYEVITVGNSRGIPGAKIRRGVLTGRVRAALVEYC